MRSNSENFSEQTQLSILSVWQNSLRLCLEQLNKTKELYVWICCLKTKVYNIQICSNAQSPIGYVRGDEYNINKEILNHRNNFTTLKDSAIQNDSSLKATPPPKMTPPSKTSPPSKMTAPLKTSPPSKTSSPPKMTSRPKTTPPSKTTRPSKTTPPPLNTPIP